LCLALREAEIEGRILETSAVRRVLDYRGETEEEIGRWRQLKFRVFWDVLPYSQIYVDRRFRGACCLHYEGNRLDDWQIGSCDGVRLRLSTAAGVLLYFPRIKANVI
jgi:hypothetical protein